MFKVPEKYRIISGYIGSDSSYGNNGAFYIPMGNSHNAFTMASDGEGWEHVSVTMSHGKTPDWVEMNQIKSIFWGDEDCVMQLHPPNSNYINNHRACLHLWRPIGQDIPQPPWALVGVK
jgi:hypothetical protein